MHLRVGQLVAALEPELLRRVRVPRNRLAIRPRLAADSSVALPRRPAAQHFLHIDHGQLPVGHRFLPDGDRRRRRDESCSLQVAHPGGPMPLRKLARSWPHDAAKLRHASLAGGPIILRKGWPHHPAKLPRKWPHDAANRQGWSVLAVLARWRQEPLMVDAARVSRVRAPRETDSVNAETLARALEGARTLLARVLS